MCQLLAAITEQQDIHTAILHAKGLLPDTLDRDSAIVKSTSTLPGIVDDSIEANSTPPMHDDGDDLVAMLKRQQHQQRALSRHGNIPSQSRLTPSPLGSPLALNNIGLERLEFSSRSPSLESDTSAYDNSLPPSRRTSRPNSAAGKLDVVEEDNEPSGRAVTPETESESQVRKLTPELNDSDSDFPVIMSDNDASSSSSSMTELEESQAVLDMLSDS